MNLALTHTRFHLLETIRVPIAVVGSIFFPAAAMLFFVVPFAGEDPVSATFATASMVTYAVMSSNLFGYGIGVANDRAEPWDPFTRTLPAGPGPRFAGRILTGIVITFASLLPVVLIAAFATAATTTPLRLAMGFVTVLTVTAPFTLLGLAVGYALPMKAALVVVQVVFFPLAFLGGLLSAPGQAPGWVETVAPFVPTRGAAELMWATVGEFTVNPLAVVMLAVWTVIFAVSAGWAYRRDEGRRFS